jgi:hypothetical protein
MGGYANQGMPMAGAGVSNAAFANQAVGK